MYVLKKETKRRNYQSRTGGGSPITVNLSSLEEELDFITPEAAGLENIPQGGLNLHQSASCSQEEMLSHNLDNIQTQDIQYTDDIQTHQDLQYMDDIQTQDLSLQFCKNNYLPLHKRLRTSNVVLNNFKGL